MANYNIIAELKYSENHEWVKDLGKNKYRAGTTDYAAKNIGDVTFVELPEVETEVDKEGVDCVIETVKSSEDIFNPIGGIVTNINETLEESPDLVNSDCYGAGWLYDVQAKNDHDFNDLMTAEEYEKFLEEQED